MNTEKEHFGFYVFNGEYYFYGWNNWSLFGTLTCFFTDLIEQEIIKNGELRSNTLYFIDLFIERDFDDPEKLINFSFKKEITKSNRIKEVRRIAKEVIDLKEQDSVLIADQLYDLVVKLKKMRLK